MKCLVVLGDGMADVPNPMLNNKTPLEVSNKPNMDRLAYLGQVGMIKTVPDGFSPGSDVANLSVLGYNPKEFYTGRSPLEALSIGIDMDDNDIAIRCNLVTIENGIMEDYSAGGISTEEASILINAVQEKLGNDIYKFYPGVSYRHCLIYKGGNYELKLTPPHDISGRDIKDYMPKGRLEAEFSALINKSNEILKAHPINLERISKGLNPATHIWLWGAGKKAKLQSFYERFNLNGTIVSAVDLLRGIAKGAKMDAPIVEGATGTLETNIEGKIQAVKDAFISGKDFVYLHIEAPDECGHQGDVEGKVKAIELVDYALGKLWEYLEGKKDDYVIALLPDHATPLYLKTHTAEPVPYALYKKSKPYNSKLKYTENEAQKGIQINGQIIQEMLK